MTRQNTALKYLPVVSDDTRIDVDVVNGDTVIKLSTWEESIGWCSQKTIQLNDELLNELHRVLTAIRVTKRGDEDSLSSAIEGSNILTFPGTI